MKQSPMETVYQSMMIGLMSVVAVSRLSFPPSSSRSFTSTAKESAQKKINS